MNVHPLYANGLCMLSILNYDVFQLICFVYATDNSCYQLMMYARSGIHPWYIHCIRLHYILFVNSWCIACMSSTTDVFPIRVTHTSNWWCLFTMIWSYLWFGPIIHNTSMCHRSMMQALLPLMGVYSVIDVTQYMISNMRIVYTVNCYCMIHLSSTYETC